MLKYKGLTTTWNISIIKSIFEQELKAYIRGLKLQVLNLVYQLASGRDILGVSGCGRFQDQPQFLGLPLDFV